MPSTPHRAKKLSPKPISIYIMSPRTPKLNWADMDSPNTPTGPLPKPPVPFRQPSYAVAQQQFAASPHSGGHSYHNEGTNTPADEEDDGGWTVDQGAQDYTERQKRKRERNRTPAETTLGIMHGMAAQVNNQAPVHSEPDEWTVSQATGDSKTQAIPKAGEPPVAVAKDNHLTAQSAEHNNDTALAETLGRSGYHLDQSTLSRIKQLLDSHQTQHIPPPPVKQQAVAMPFQPTLNADALGRGYTGPVNVHVPPHMRYADQHDPNRLIVANMKQWGAPNTRQVDNMPVESSRKNEQSDTANESTPSDGGWATPAPAETAQNDSTSDGGWAPVSKVQEWVKSVHPATPPSESTPVVPNSPESISFPARPDSTRPVPDPVTLYISDDDSGPDTDLPTPGKNDIEPSPTVIPDRAPKSPTPRPSTRDGRRTDAGTDEAERRQRGRPQRRVERSGVLWKRDPHPAFSPRFANKRILIRFPFPIRSEAIRQTMSDHFAKYGSIRMTWFHEPQGDSCEQVILVFDNEDAVDACLADTSHTTCLIKSSGGHAGITPVDIKVTHAPGSLTAKTVYIKVNGKRADARSRSASPPRRSEWEQERARRKDQSDWIVQDLPAAINIDAVPSRRKYNGMIEFWARVRELHVSFDNVMARAWNGTGREAFPIHTFDLGRRVPEKDIIPHLCEYFAEIVDIIPPTSREQGWLVTVGNAVDGRNLIAEMSKIPGILARWAHPEDGVPREGEDGPPQVEQSPMTRLEQDFGGQMSRDAAFRPRSQRKETEGDLGEKFNNALNLHTSPVTVKENIQPAQPRSPASNKSHASVKPNTSFLPAEIIDPRYPHLRKRIIPIYRGRTLREDLSEENPRFFDDAAVFVGRLVKEQETEESLFQRFSRYGQVCAVEYNPKNVITTYATARILFSAKAAADRALKYEQGAVSFGSLLKIEKRRVLPSDVQLEERFIDEWGRAYSPSMASQYSPPSSPIEDEVLFVHPPPMNTAPTPMSLPLFQPPPFLQWAPHPMPPGMLHGSPFPSSQPSPGQDGTAQPFPPQPMHGPSGPAGGPRPALMPVLYAMGVGYYPPHGLNLSAPLNPLPTPPITPHVNQYPSSMPNGNNANPPHDPSTNPDEPSSSSQNPSVTAEASDPASVSSRRRSPKVAETRMENGMFKVIYDDDDLRRFCKEEGCPEPKPRDKGKHRADVPLSPKEPMSNGNGNPNGHQQRLQPVPIPFSPPQGSQPIIHGLGMSGPGIPPPMMQGSPSGYALSHGRPMPDQQIYSGTGGGNPGHMSRGSVEESSREGPIFMGTAAHGGYHQCQSGSMGGNYGAASGQGMGRRHEIPGVWERERA